LYTYKEVNVACPVLKSALPRFTQQVAVAVTVGVMDAVEDGVGEGVLVGLEVGVDVARVPVAEGVEVAVTDGVEVAVPVAGGALGLVEVGEEFLLPQACKSNAAPRMTSNNDFPFFNVPFMTISRTVLNSRPEYRMKRRENQ
jgi:hypothetical protein